jgi:hypothetical protein
MIPERAPAAVMQAEWRLMQTRLEGLEPPTARSEV